LLLLGIFTKIGILVSLSFAIDFFLETLTPFKKSLWEEDYILIFEQSLM